MKIEAYKGFNADMTCREFQFKEGETYIHEGEVEPCASGFHACENPVDIFRYYRPSESIYHKVTLSGDIKRDGDKVVGSIITIGERVTLHDMLHKEGRSKGSSVSTNTGHYSVSTNTGHYSASTNTGLRSASTNTGLRSASTNTGYGSVSTNTGYGSVSTNTGDCSASMSTGDCSASMSTGCYSSSEVTGLGSVAISLGIQSRARASSGGAIFLAYHNMSGNLLHIKASKVGENGVKPDVWYTLDGTGNFKEVEV